MKTWMALAITAGIIVASAILGAIVNAVMGGGNPESNPGIVPVMFIMIGSALWVAIDAWRIGTGRYKMNGLCRFLGLDSPVKAFFGCILLWLIAFPLYLTIKGKISRGELPLKQQ